MDTARTPQTPPTPSRTPKGSGEHPTAEAHAEVERIAFQRSPFCPFSITEDEKVLMLLMGIHTNIISPECVAIVQEMEYKRCIPESYVRFLCSLPVERDSTVSIRPEFEDFLLKR